MVAAPLPPSRQAPAAYTGGEDIPRAIESVSNVRTIIQPIYNRAAVLSANNIVEIPKVGYAKVYRVILSGSLTCTPGTGTITAGDPRKLLANIAFSMQGATRIHTVNGILENLINMVDNQVVNNKQTFSVNSGANTFYMEWEVMLPYTEANLGGLVYKGGGATYPTLEVTLGAVTDILALTGNATAAFASLNLKVQEERIDAEAPRSPERVIVTRGNEQVEEIIPGRGLWEETTQFISTFVDRREEIPGPNVQIPVDLQLGLPYLRLFLVSYLNNAVDSGDTILSGYKVRLENTTDMWEFDLDFSDRLYRDLYYKNRPGGVHVISFIDRTASDRDILYSRDLGRLELTLITASTAVAGSGNFVQLGVQQAVPLQAAAMY